MILHFSFACRTNEAEGFSLRSQHLMGLRKFRNLKVAATKSRNLGTN
jgi:hypothetical protein